MITFIVYVLSNGFALWLAQHFVPGFIVHGGLKEYLIIAIILAILNLIAKPILKLITFPIIILTLGLFNLVLSAILIWSVTWITDLVVVENLISLVLATLIFAVINSIGHHIAKAS